VDRKPPAEPTPEVQALAWSRLRLLLVVLTALLVGIAALPAAAQAHGPVAPVASSYLAKVRSAPAGLNAKVVDGDLRMWLQVPPTETVVVLDYRGAPYLRFSRSGVEVNQNSAMYYLNQTPVAETPPAKLGPKTPPRWDRVTGSHDYSWHDGRLHALAVVALSPGAAYVGAWRIPVVVDGRLSAISGELWHAPDPSIVWFWPIVVLLLCVLAAWRLRRPDLDRRVARMLALAALASVAVAAFGRELHGRPTVSVFQFVELGALLAFVAWGSVRVLWRRSGYFSYFVIAIVALWQGAVLIPTLLDGYVLIALPAVVARAASVVSLGAGVGLLLLVFRLFDAREESRVGGPHVDEHEGEDDSTLELV
jgi:hypothetical protein